MRQGGRECILYTMFSFSFFFFTVNLKTTALAAYCSQRSSSQLSMPVTGTERGTSGHRPGRSDKINAWVRTKGDGTFSGFYQPCVLSAQPLAGGSWAGGMSQGDKGSPDCLWRHLRTSGDFVPAWEIPPWMMDSVETNAFYVLRLKS